MIIHQDTLISEDIFEKEFVCNLNQCKGSCCVEGDFGAPLSTDEIQAITDNLDAIKPYMSRKGLHLLSEKGFNEIDIDGDHVTTCIEHRDCIFTVNENGVYKCAIENAWKNGDSPIQKPISCHLYPVRVESVGDYVTLNYDKWEICDSACSLGQSLKVPVYVFLKDSLQRAFGESWYSELETIAKEYSRQA